MKIEILKEDIMPYVYFVCSMAYESESGMHGALGSKNDFIGGIFDRWINIIPESIIFNKKILLDVSNEIFEETGEKFEIKVFSDFFKYKPSVVGIAPDVLGIKANDKIIPFVKYDEKRDKKNFWVPQNDSPQIEVKSFKESQYLVSLRNQNYDDKYLVMVETNLSVDYLLPFFDSNVFNEDVYKKLEVPDVFIQSNEDKHLKPTNKISELNKLGDLEILLVTRAREFMDNSTKCLRGESIRYIESIKTNKNKTKKPERSKRLKAFFQEEKLASGLYRENEKFKKLFSHKKTKTLDIYFSELNSIKIFKINKNSIVIETDKDCKINEVSIEKDKQYTIHFGILDRGTNKSVDSADDAGSEYFFDKKLLEFLKDESESLIHDIKKTILEGIE